MPEEDLAFTPAWRLRTMIPGKEISPVELTELYLRRIETVNPELTLDDPWPTHEKILFVDTYLNVRQLLGDHAHKLTPYVRKAAEIGEMTSGVQYEEALRNVIVYRVSMGRFMERCDLLLTPTVPVPAYPIESAPRAIGGREVPEVFWRYFGFNSFTCPFNASGQPAATIPCGSCENGLPEGRSHGSSGFSNLRRGLFLAGPTARRRHW